MNNCLRKGLYISLLGILILFLYSFAAIDSLNALSINSNEINSSDARSYKNYINSFEEIYPESEILIELNEYDIEKTNNIEIGLSNTIITYEDSSITWSFNVQEEGFYNINISYFPLDGNGLSIQRMLLIDDNIPFHEAEVLSFHRLWQDSADIKTENGNEIRPSQIETPSIINYYIADELKINSGYLKFYLTQGSHTLSLMSIREPMEIISLSFVPVVAVLSYEEQLQKWQNDGLSIIEGIPFTKYQAENNGIKSSPSLYATTDYTSPITENYQNQKNHLYKIRLNLAGGLNWRTSGDFIEWEIDVPKEGLYELSFKYLQDMKPELSSIRNLYINGEIPFYECENIEFQYSSKFKMKTLGSVDGNYLFHLKKGQNTIKLEVGLGKYADAINDIRNLIDRLSELYREIIIITGTNPDVNTDYQLKKYIPDIVQRLTSEKQAIEQIIETITDSNGKKTEETIALNKIQDQLEEFAYNTYKISLNLSLFSSNISSLGTSLNNLLQQPLKIDYFGFHSPQAKLPKGRENFFQKVWYEIKRLIVSFFVDYDSLGSGTVGEENIEVWVLSGRDQTQVIKNLISSEFTPNNNIGVKLKVVPGSALLPNTLVGRGPDVVLMVGNDLPTQYAFRNAAYDLSKFPELESFIESNYYESALTNLRYDGGIYGLPETISFPVLFYREDIVVNQLGLNIPNTWDELMELMLVLQNYNMDIYLGQPSNVNNSGIDVLFASLLYQNGGDFYLNKGEETLLRNEVAISTFIKWTEFYTQYGIPLHANFVNRFRSGDMPIGISDYSLYNTLMMSAPEIAGKWKMALLPGTLNDDGEIDRKTISAGTASMIIKNTKNPDAAWEFLKWWASGETQATYGREIESVLGVSARYSTANINALRQLAWSANDSKIIQEQYSYVKGFEQVPGGYMTARQLNYAFRNVINNNANPRETLLEYTLAINLELKIKRKEFGLE